MNFTFSLQDFKEAACDKNEAKNISLLYNLPGVAGPSGVARQSRPRKRAEKRGSEKGGAIQKSQATRIYILRLPLKMMQLQVHIDGHD